MAKRVHLVKWRLPRSRTADSTRCRSSRALRVQHLIRRLWPSSRVCDDDEIRIGEACLASGVAECGGERAFINKYKYKYTSTKVQKYIVGVALCSLQSTVNSQQSTLQYKALIRVEE